jgi:hypothetical protein
MYAPTDVAVVEPPPQPAPVENATPPQPAEPTPAPAPEVQPPPAEPPPEDDTWEHRYKVLNGKYSKEVPRLYAELRELKAELEKAKSDAERLKSNPQEKAQLVKPEEVEEYGQGLVDLIRRAAREEISEKDRRIEELEHKLNMVEQKSAKTVEIDFYTRLADLVPDYVVINDKPEFHKWLGEPDELTGVERQVLLEDAESKRDPVRVAKFFQAWKRTTETRTAVANSQLSAHVVPDAGSPTATAPTAKRMWTRADVARVYSAIRRGEVTDAEAAALESEIHAATMEGRLR